jgi:hypothetical protein
MPVGNMNLSLSTINHSWQQITTDQGAGLVQQYVGGTSPVSLPAAQTATISGEVLTFSAPHGFTTANVLGLQWTGGQRVNCAIASVTTTTVTLQSPDGGYGSALPSSGSVTVGAAVALPDAAFTGTDAHFILATNTAGAAAIDCFASGSSRTALLNVSLVGAGNVYGYYWTYSSGLSDPFSGAATASMNVYNFGTAVSTFQMSVILNT